ncbi:MAG: hypothetical protein V9G18_21420 [Albidovulum sp.]
MKNQPPGSGRFGRSKWVSPAAAQSAAEAARVRARPADGGHDHRRGGEQERGIERQDVHIAELMAQHRQSDQDADRVADQELEVVLCEQRSGSAVAQRRRDDGERPERDHEVHEIERPGAFPDAADAGPERACGKPAGIGEDGREAGKEDEPLRRV